MFFYLYQITNNLNGKIYVGVHKTQQLDDGYMGSGKVIKRAIEKYGIENFTKEILETFDSNEEMFQREKEIVTEEFISRNDVYNIKMGGRGGFTYDMCKNGRKAVDEILYERYGANWKHIVACRGGTARKLLYLSPNKNSLANLKLGNMPAVREKARYTQIKTYNDIKHQQGNKNSQFGTCWIYHELIGNKKCKKDLLPLYIDQGWYKGRNLKF